MKPMLVKYLQTLSTSKDKKIPVQTYSFVAGAVKSFNKLVNVKINMKYKPLCNILHLLLSGICLRHLLEKGKFIFS